AESGLPTELLGATAAVFADFDNDADKDLFVGCFTGQNRMFRNDGRGSFTDVTASANVGGLFVTSAAAADYDNDGRLDLYLGRYLDPRTEFPTYIFYARNGAGNILLRNEGGLHFSDATEQAGVREGGLTQSVAWVDFDQDGDQDIYVVNDTGRNALLRNDGGVFRDATSATGTHTGIGGMNSAITFGDIDNDLDLDFYTSSQHSSHRWYIEGSGPILQAHSIWRYRKIEPVLLDYLITVASLPATQRLLAQGNTLLLNNGRGVFRDATLETGTNPLGWYFNAAIFDFDNDGRQDIYAVNGFITAASKVDT
ncbi:MAG: VCBS repeat-containing protein, partial [Planctomycetes bacterium]|nr:VCBS repeat-containing protein [Planctomycetota bacterium]